LDEIELLNFYGEWYEDYPRHLPLILRKDGEDAPFVR
jgi:hypothetical protein